MSDDDSKVGLGLIAALPEDDGLSPLAETLDANRGQIVVAIGTLRVATVLDRVERDTSTVKLRWVQIESSSLTADERATLQAILEAASTRRTGNRAMLGADGEPHADALPGATDAPALEEGEGGKTAVDPPAFSDPPAAAKATKAAPKKATKAAPGKPDLKVAGTG